MCSLGMLKELMKGGIMLEDEDGNEVIFEYREDVCKEDIARAFAAYKEAQDDPRSVEPHVKSMYRQAASEYSSCTHEGKHGFSEPVLSAFSDS